MNRWLLLAVATSVGLAACSKKEEPVAAAPSAPQAAAPAPAAPAPAAPVAAAPQAAAPQAGTPARAPNSGKIIQLLQTPAYTYAEIDGGTGRTVWVAGGHIEAKPGDIVQWGQYSVMQNFTAKSLGRTFDEILFVNAWGPVGAPLAQVAPHGVQPGAHPPMAQQPAAAAGPGSESGKVLSVATAAGYSYLEVQKSDSTVWVAVPETSVQVGDSVSWGDGMVMKNFTSKALNRTFDQIVFASGVSVAK